MPLLSAPCRYHAISIRPFGGTYTKTLQFETTFRNHDGYNCTLTSSFPFSLRSWTSSMKGLLHSEEGASIALAEGF